MCPKSLSSCPVDGDLDDLLAAVRERFAELPSNACQRKVFLNRLRNLARFGAEPLDYPEPVETILPKELEIGFAVCHPECGNQAFVVVEGGPQACDSCGGTLYPAAVGTYRLKKR